MKFKHLLSVTLPVAAGFMLAASVHAQDQPAPAPSEEQPADAAAPAEPSLSDLEQLMNLPAPSAIKEYQEDLAKPKSIFDSQSAIDRIFQKTKPAFIYFPEGADPMIIPWERERVIAQERFEEATSAVANKDYKKAIDTLKEIREKYPNTEEGQKAPAEIEKINALMLAEAPSGISEPVPVIETKQNLPEWVRKNTSAVLITETPTVMVGNDFLREGDAVPRYAGVKVKSISDSEVVYTYLNQEFPVQVEGSF
ncbi:hypothetical protein IT571_10455 [Candidatus Sumerlaeota bacterium]|nr:hypothetical protein [Candidatus Sumerlaeota bacterium]